jgi:TonB-dependent SusC/RagA subfamily outer membrane receptor
MGLYKWLQKTLRMGLILFLGALFVFSSENVQALQGQVAYRMTSHDLQEKFYEAKINDKINLDLQNVSLEEGLKKIADKTGFNLTFRSDIIDKNSITLRDSDISVSNALEKILYGTNLIYKISQDGYLLIEKNTIEDNININVFQETISGQVTNETTGESIPGVNILIKGTSSGTSTNADGQFELSVPSLNETLVVSYIGYVTKEVPINGRVTLDIQLMSAFLGLDEVIVLGYGTQEKSDLTGSVSQISTADNIEGQAVSNLNQALQGKVAGVQFTSTSGDPGAQVNVRIRGLNTFGDSGPLYIVDGLMMEQQDINSINPNDIETTTVLKDASASAIYGSRAANGVIIITTKSGRQGPTQVTYNGYYGVQTFNDFLPLQLLN